MDQSDADISSSHAAKHRSGSKLGLYSLLSGLILLAAEAALPYIPGWSGVLSNASTNAPYDLSYALVGVLSLASVLFLSIPSFKKIPYPNVWGLIGIILNVLVFATAVTSISLFYPFGSGQ
ncbi:MAG TPA: hypothetical protein VGS28_01185 [Candidatus Saccharimonadales bacterium]|nr:hypothetical protein [Candidatus Saccharimonadales bacterium]